MQSKSLNRISETMQTVLKNLNDIIDVNTVVGAPIKDSNGEYIIPLSKVTVGVITGGGEYGKLGIFKKGEDLPFTAGNGAVVSIKPCAFLVKENEKYKLLSVSSNSYEKLIDKATDFIMELNDEKNH